MKCKATSKILLSVLCLLSSVTWASTPWYVNGATGSDSNNCTTATTACKTISRAISLAASGDTIQVAAATYTENLTIGISLTILGSGAATTVVDGGVAGTVVTIDSGSQVTLSQLTIQNGHAALHGGGIYNLGSLDLISSTVSTNTVGVTYCVELCGAWGGGIYNYSGATMMISKSTIANNVVDLTCSKGGCSVRGGGILNNGTMTITNSTLSGNIAEYFFNGTETGSGGGIYNGGILTINNSTISGNTAFGSGGGIDNPGTATMQNSIVANSPAGGNCSSSGTMISNAYNLSSDKTCEFNNTGDMNNTHPKLGTLGYYGGPTQTIPLLSGSPAIDAGNPSGCTDSLGYLLKTDQRGFPRPDPEDTGGCDIGAFERQSD